MQRIMVGMSGGIDSSVAALRLSELGYDVCGVTLRLLDDGCESLIADAYRVCETLGIPHVVLDFRNEFSCRVIMPFIETYRRGETPNPCIECNRHIKFPLMLGYARDRGYDGIATGHYARIEYCEASRRHRLLKGVSREKDQSYVLYSLSQDTLAHTLFPLGDMSKDAVRDIARQYGLATADKPDSQDICFIPHGNYATFLEREGKWKAEEGLIVDEEGTVLGTHRGLYHYTIGQRKGIGIAPRSIEAAPYYVIEIDVAQNLLVVGDKDALGCKAVRVKDVNWVSVPRPETEIPVLVKTRYAQRCVRAVLKPCNICEEKGKAVGSSVASTQCDVVFDSSLDAVAPGQACVFYDEADMAVLGGGTIART